VPTTVTRHELKSLVQGGAQLVEVLPLEEYTEEHLPGAINLPLRSLTAETAETLARTRPVIVY
jgi:rhodanese-related sulfurtransferase